MSLLNLNGPAGRAPRSKNSSRAWMGIGLVIAVLGIGSTFASSITINSPSTATEFGQGVQKTVYCGNTTQTLNVIPVSSYKNGSSSSTTGGTFTVTGIRVSQIPDACSDMNFVISMYTQSEGGDPLPLASASAITTPSASAAPAAVGNELTVYWVKATSSNPTYIPARGPDSAAAATSSSACQNVVTSPSVVSMSNGDKGGLLSLKRSSYVSPCRIAYLTVLNTGNKDSFQINFKTGSGITNSDSLDAARIVIETQEDTFGADLVRNTTTVTSGALGLAYNGLP